MGLCLTNYDSEDSDPAPHPVKPRSQMAILSCSEGPQTTPHQFCKNCFRQYVTSVINQDNIPCPQAGCDHVFQVHELKDYMERPEFDRRMDLLKEKAYGEDIVHCPNPRCKWVCYAEVKGQMNNSIGCPMDGCGYE